MPSLNINLRDSQYRALIGTGGVGSGIFFALEGNHTLGREESRGGRFLDQRDYCKLHIIAHYVKTLAGPDFETILVSRVGEDAWGYRLLDEMNSAGLDTRFVALCAGEKTLLSVCFLYPDGSGGNLTASDSACSRVDAEYISGVELEFARFAGRGVALAAPEVSLEARLRLLQLGQQYGFLKVAAFTSAEMQPAVHMGLLALTDMLSLNLDEAAALLGWSAEKYSPTAIVESAIQRLQALNPKMLIALTAGKNGSWAWDGICLTHTPAYPVRVASSAGAGDAFLAALIVSMVAGLSWAQAQELASLTAALSVTSPHTIHPGLERDSLRVFADQLGAPLSDAVQVLLRSDLD